MCLSADTQVGRFERALDLGDELVMGNRTPAFRGIWCVHFPHFLQIDVMSAAMKNEVGGCALSGDGLGIEVCYHGVGFLSGYEKAHEPLEVHGLGCGFGRVGRCFVAAPYGGGCLGV